jgi:microcystin-dependent protein
MRNFLFTTASALLISITMFSQGNSGLGFNYQAVVRGVDGFVIPEQPVELRFSLMPGQQATEASWVETHDVTTDDYGTVGVTIGKGIKAGGVAAAFKDVNFSAVLYWLKVEIKENSTYRELSYTQLTSVPYAEVATNAVGSPTGSVMPFAGDASKVPEGWLLCNGNAVSRSEYAALYEVIGTAYGFGNNSTTFNLPDMRGMFLRGVSGDSEKDADAETRLPLKEGGNSGNQVGSYQSDEFESHKHGLSAFITLAVGSSSAAPGAFQPADNFTSDTRPNAMSATGGNETRPKNIYVNYIIKY